MLVVWIRRKGDGRIKEEKRTGVEGSEWKQGGSWNLGDQLFSVCDRKKAILWQLID